jgi:hypothetical protein
MKNSPSALSISILIFATIGFLTGCAGLTGNPAPNPTPTPVAHGTFVFVSGSTSGFATLTDGFRLNPDGSLTALSGSPFPISGQVAGSGRFLMSVSQGSLTSYRVNPVTGVPTLAASATIPQFVDTLGADARNVYVAGANDIIGNFIYGFSVADSGALTPVPGLPQISGGPCDQCPLPLFPNLALNNNFFALSVEGYRGTGGISIYRRDSNGSLTPGGFTGFEGQSAAALQPPAGNVAFSLISGRLTSYQLGPNGTPSQAMTLDPAGFDAVDETVDPTGKFLLVVDSSGAVHVFSIDAATADFSPVSTSEPAGDSTSVLGDGVNMMAMDPSGRFVIVAQSSEGGFLSTPDRLTVFTFDPGSGAMRKLQSYPMDKSPFRIAFVTE